MGCYRKDEDVELLKGNLEICVNFAADDETLGDNTTAHFVVVVGVAWGRREGGGGGGGGKFMKLKIIIRYWGCLYPYRFVLVCVISHIRKHNNYVKRQHTLTL